MRYFITVLLLTIANCILGENENRRILPTVEINQALPLLVSDTLFHQLSMEVPEEIEERTFANYLAPIVYDTIYDASLALLPHFTEEEVMTQVYSMPTLMNLTYNEEVQKYITRYTQSWGRRHVAEMLAKSQYYFPIMEDILLKNGLPSELKYLSVIESALKPKVVSHAGAVGLWQFMYHTGKAYDLEINSMVDERKSLIASTEAASDFLNDLYERYGDWMLALAAYNCGPGNVNKAIRRANGKRDYWEIYDYLPRETRGYVPKFIAMMYAFYYHQTWDIKPYMKAGEEMVWYTDTITINKPVHLEQIARVLNVDESTVFQLNPQFVKGVVPANNKAYKLLLPSEHIETYWAYQDSIYNLDRSQYFDQEEKLLAQSKPLYMQDKTSAQQYIADADTEVISYKVKSGDVLGTIAQKFETTTSKIKKWNNLKSTRLKIGQSLKIYVPSKKLAHYPQPIKEAENRNTYDWFNDYVSYPATKSDDSWIYSPKV